MKNAILKYELIQKLINTIGLLNDKERKLLVDLSLEILVFVNVNIIRRTSNENTM